MMCTVFAFVIMTHSNFRYAINQMTRSSTNKQQLKTTIVSLQMHKSFAFDRRLVTQVHYQ